MRMLAVREHTRTELRRKLLGRHFQADAVEQVLGELVEHGLLSDRRFVESYVNERMGKGFGPLRIKAELRDKGVDGDTAVAALDVDDEVWMEVLARAHNKKFGSGPAASRADMAKRARFLEYRGFSSAQVSRFLHFDD